MHALPSGQVLQRARTAGLAGLAGRQADVCRVGVQRVAMVRRIDQNQAVVGGVCAADDAVEGDVLQGRVLRGRRRRPIPPAGAAGPSSGAVDASGRDGSVSGLSPSGTLASARSSGAAAPWSVFSRGCGTSPALSASSALSASRGGTGSACSLGLSEVDSAGVARAGARPRFGCAPSWCRSHAPASHV